MTRRTFETDTFRVVTGWDRRLQDCCLDMSLQTREPTPEPIFSHQFRRHPAMPMAEIADTLARERVTAPEGLWRDLTEDLPRNRGHLEVSDTAPEPRNRAMPPSAEAEPPRAEMGPRYRLTWEDGGQGLYGPLHLHAAALSQVVQVERLEEA
jgi:hypothetical protein